MNQRKIKVVIVALLVFLLSGCQLFSDYVFINQSGERVSIEYKIRRDFFRIPTGTSLNDYGTAEKKWKRLEAKTRHDPDGLITINLEVPHNYVLMVTSSDIYYSRHDPEKFLGVTEFRIDGKRGSQYFSGDRVFEQFEEKIRGGWIFPRVPEYIYRYK